MKYILLIYHEELVWSRLTEAERQDIYREYRQLIQKLRSLRVSVANQFFSLIGRRLTVGGTT